MARRVVLLICTLMLLLEFSSTHAADADCPAQPPNCPGVSNGIRMSANSTHTLAGVFPVSLWQVVRNECSLCADAPRSNSTGATDSTTTSSSTQLFAVEQSEALIVATELVNSMTHLDGSVNFGYDIRDSCGNHMGSDCINTLDPLANTLATVVGPYYAGMTASLDDDEVLSIFSRLDAKNGSTDRLIFSLLDVPFSYARTMGRFASGNGSAQVIMLEPSCELQALAAVDFIARKRWLDVTVFGNGDACGRASLRAFKEELDRKGIACHFEVIINFIIM